MNKHYTYQNKKIQSFSTSSEGLDDDYLHEYSILYNESSRSYRDLLPPPVQWHKSLINIFQFCHGGPLSLLGIGKQQEQKSKENKDFSCNKNNVQYWYSNNNRAEKKDDKFHRNNYYHPKQHDPSEGNNTEEMDCLPMDGDDDLTRMDKQENHHGNRDRHDAAELVEEETSLSFQKPTTEIIIPFRLDIQGGAQHAHNSDSSTCSLAASLITISSSEHNIYDDDDDDDCGGGNGDDKEEEQCQMAFHTAKKNSMANPTKRELLIVSPSIAARVGLTTTTNAVASADDDDAAAGSESKPKKEGAATAATPNYSMSRTRRATTMVTSLPPGINLYSRIAKNMSMPSSNFPSRRPVQRFKTA